MSAGRIAQLKSLLARVQERRAAPRLRDASAPASSTQAQPSFSAMEQSSVVPSANVLSAAPTVQPAAPVPSAAPTTTTGPSWGGAKTMLDPRPVPLDRELPSAAPEVSLADVLAKSPSEPPVEIRGSAREPSAEARAAEVRDSAREPNVEASRTAPTVNDLKPLSQVEPSHVQADMEAAFDSEPPTSATVIGSGAASGPSAISSGAASGPSAINSGAASGPSTISAAELAPLPTAVPSTRVEVPSPITAPSARVEAPVLSRAEPVVRAVSAPRVEAPKSFGDLLESSLSLRTH